MEMSIAEEEEADLPEGVRDGLGGMRGPAPLPASMSAVRRPSSSTGTDSLRASRTAGAL